MDIDSVRRLSDEDLAEELSNQKRHLYDLRFQLATRQLTDHSQLTSARRTIARLLTVMTERGLDENEIVRRATPAEAPRRTLRRGRGTKPATTTSSSSKSTSATSRTTSRRTSTTASKSKEAATEAASGGNEE